jgi:hypothetical protein
MLCFYPSYYEKFRCIAGECPDTCCAGWEIVVDGESAARYASLDGEIGERIRSAMSRDADGDLVFKNRDGRCPFLNRENLCDIIIGAGEEQLCATCRKFPRFSTAFGGVEEWGLSLSCPEAAKYILKAPALPDVCVPDGRDPDLNDLDAELYLFLKSERKRVFDFILGSELTRDSLCALLAYSDELQASVESGELNSPGFSGRREVKTDVLRGLDYLTDDGKSLFRDLGEPSPLTDAHRNILLYYVYRYFLAAAYDGRAALALRLGALAVECVSRANADEKTAAVRFAKEIEHSADNLDAIFAADR